jgi:3'(2'), 5'-bisphosphate nucleotidase
VGAWEAAQAPGGERGEPIAIRVGVPGAGLRAVASARHGGDALEGWLADAGVTSRVAIGSSLKFALVARGEADIYPRLGPTMEWDTAAGDAVLRAAGGTTLGPDGAPLRYGKPGHRNGAFLATGGARPALPGAPA